jgi:cystathionine gamma-synthase
LQRFNDLVMARDFLTDPLWQEEDMGKAVPETPHAVSVCLPTWKQVVGYEECDPMVLGMMETGYPRFFVNRIVRELNSIAADDYAAEGELAVIFPNVAAAERCCDFLDGAGRVEFWEEKSLGVLLVPDAWEKRALEYVRYTGELVSSYRAESLLAGRGDDQKIANQVGETLRSRIAEHSGMAAADVYLFPNGMAAVYTLHRALRQMFPDRKTAQYDFPYVDVLRVQKEFGHGAHFHPRASAESLEELRSLVDAEDLGGIFCEMPSNPLLRCAGMGEISQILSGKDVPLIVDDTVASSVNISLTEYADAVTTSLTKFFSGVGDVMGGSVVLNANRPHYAVLKAAMEEVYEPDLFWWEDAVVLERNSRDYAQRVRQMNVTASALVDHLSAHPGVAEVFYPSLETPEAYAQVQREGAGFGALFSIVLKEPENTSAKFFDALRVTKGPSLGTNYTLACPYTLLAHYPELDWAEGCGVSRWLVRVSVGLEDLDELISRFDVALARAGAGQA